ncbi:hypothetical protein AMTRI_Chr06g173510 [Amborella trichopoda]
MKKKKKKTTSSLQPARARCHIPGSHLRLSLFSMHSGDLVSIFDSPFQSSRCSPLSLQLPSARNQPPSFPTSRPTAIVLQPAAPNLCHQLLPPHPLSAVTTTSGHHLTLFFLNHLPAATSTHL